MQLLMFQEIHKNIVLGQIVDLIVVPLDQRSGDTQKVQLLMFQGCIVHKNIVLCQHVNLIVHIFIVHILARVYLE